MLRSDTRVCYSSVRIDAICDDLESMCIRRVTAHITVNTTHTVGRHCALIDSSRHA
jgi:hypothetical protein